MNGQEIIELAREAGLLVIGTADGGEAVYTWPAGITEEIETFAKLVAAKERSEMRKGYAGVTLWVGDACVTQIVSEALIEHEIKRGMALKYAAEKCLAIYLEARGEA